MALRARENPQAWLEQSRIYGDLNAHANFANAFTQWLGLIWQDGCEAAMAKYTKVQK